MIKPIFEFLMWNNCNNNCSFCWQKELKQHGKYLDSDGKMRAMDSVMAFIASESFQFGSHILLVGGELFDTRFDGKLLCKYKEFINFIAKRVSVGKIDLLYLNTNLIYKDLTYLFMFLDTLNRFNCIDRVKFTTSYDVFGRFKDEEARTLVLENIKTLKDKYADLQIVTNIILTKQACEAILANKLNLKEFTEKNRVRVNTIPYIVLHDNMAPTISDVIKTLKHISTQIPNYFSDYVANISLPQDKLLYDYVDGVGLEFCSSKNAPCGHSVNFNKCSTDYNGCFVCRCIEELKK